MLQGRCGRLDELRTQRLRRCPHARGRSSQPESRRSLRRWLELKNVGHANALPTNAGAASALAFFDGDSRESIGAHIESPDYS